MPARNCHPMKFILSAATGLSLLFALFILLGDFVSAGFPETLIAAEKPEGPDNTGDSAKDEDLANKDRDSALPREERARKPIRGGIINVGNYTDPATLNNLMRNDGNSQRICHFLYPPLMQLHPDTFGLVPCTAACAPEVSEDKLRYTWKLRKGLKWDDFEESGAYLTTRDVKFSYDLMMNPATSCPHINDHKHLVDLRVKDEYTFEVVYDKPCVDAVYKMGREFRIAPAHLLDETPPSEIAKHPIGRNPVGYGPFRFKHWREQDEILIVTNEANRAVFPELYRPYVDGIRYRKIPDSKMRVKQFLRENIDLVMLTADDWEHITETEEFTKVGTRHHYYLPWWNYIAWNNKNALFSDARVRRAMTHMVRRDEILDTHRSGLGTTLSGPFYIQSKAYDHSIEPLPFDPESAARLLKEAGWEDHDNDGILDREIEGERVKFEFEFLIFANRNAYLDALILALQQDLRKAGIIMQIRSLEWSAFYDRIEERAFEAMCSGYRTSPIFEDPYRKWHSSLAEATSNNKPGYKNPEVDRFLEQVRLEFDETERYNILKAVHRIIHEDQPCTFLYSLASLVAVNKRWRNVKIHKVGCYLYEWWLPEENRKPSDEIPK